MREFYFGKIIRDEILSSMQQEGCEVKFEKLSGKKRRLELTKKLTEEAAELINTTSKQHYLEELGDVQLVIDAILSDLSRSERLRFKIQHDRKLKQKGGFNDGVWIESVAVPDGNKWIKYFEASPDKYPEITK